MGTHMPSRPIVRLNEHPCHRGIGITAVLSSTRGPRDTEAPSLGTGAAWARCPPEAGPKAVHQLPVWRAGRGMGCTSQMSPLLLVLWNAVCVCREGGGGDQEWHDRTHKPVFRLPQAITGGAHSPFLPSLGHLPAPAVSLAGESGRAKG